MTANSIFFYPHPHTGSFVSLEFVKRAMLADNNAEFYVSERLSAFARTPSGERELEHLPALPLVERMTHALLASAYDGELGLFVKVGKAYFELHDSITRNKHLEVCMFRSLAAGCLRASASCPSGQVRNGALLYVEGREASLRASTLIASPARIHSVAVQLLEDHQRLTWAEFLAGVRAVLPLAKTSDIEAIWNSKLIPAAWHRGGRPKSAHRNRT